MLKPPYREMDQTFPTLSTAERLHLKGGIHKFFSYFVHWFQVYKKDLRDIGIVFSIIIIIATLFSLFIFLISKVGSFLQSKFGVGGSIVLVLAILIRTILIGAIVSWVRHTNETLHRQILDKYETKKS